MQQIQSVRLTFTSGSSDKEYRIHLVEDNGLFVVNFQYGRRNGTLRDGTKTKTPLKKEEAEKIFNKILKEQLSDGYILDGEATPSAIQIVAKTKDATQVQLLKELKEEDVLDYLTNPNYFMQEKKDGERRTLDKSNKGVHGGNKKGEKVSVSKEVTESLSQDDIELDGELVGEILFVFDLLRLDKKDLKKLSYEKRLEKLESLEFGKNVVVVETAKTTKDKSAMKEKLQKENAEGFVVKDKTAHYTVGRDSSTAFKYKFYKTATVKIISISKGKRSVQMSVQDGESIVEVGSVTIPTNKEVPNVGDYAEVRYLYAYKGGSLFQPVYLFARTDVDDSDISISQLEYKKEK